MELNFSMGDPRGYIREETRIDVIEAEAQGSVPRTVNSPGCLAT